MPNINERITEKAFEVLEGEPEGIRYTEFIRRVKKLDKTFKHNTVHGTIVKLPEKYSDRVYKPSRGLFRLTKYRDDDAGQPRDVRLRKQSAETIKEEQFYKPFREWLVDEMEECTKAISLGGNCFRDKWGTPDVIGIRKRKPSDIIQSPVEIVSAEIKSDALHLVTAFGQACAYCLFSHKSYLVVPTQAPADELARSDALCQAFGIGFVLFDSENPKDPGFTIRCRPRFQQPDMFYVNRNMKVIEKALFE